MEAEGRFFLWLALPLLIPPPCLLSSTSSSVIAIEGISHQNLHPPGGVNREAEAKESNYVLYLLYTPVS